MLLLPLALLALGVDVNPPGHPAEGLPAKLGPIAAYAADPSGPINELHALLFVARRVPSEVGAALPGERKAGGLDDEAFYKKGWYFRKRPGAEADALVFGGDVRISPVESYTPEEARRLIHLLEHISTPAKVNARPELADPTARLMLQWDVLSVWWRLEESKKHKADPALLAAMARAVAALALPEATLKGLPDGRRELASQFPGGAPADRRRPYLPAGLLDALDAPKGSPWVEVQRNSSKLFHGATSLRSARVLIRAGTAEQGRALIASAAEAGEKKARPPAAPQGTEAALVLTLLGITPDLRAVATPVIDELRVRALVAPAALDLKADTSSVDGLNQWLYFRRRSATANPGAGAYRFIPDTAQSLFLEYGTAKHTTFAAQCVLCHRTTDDGGQAPSGLRSLSRFARPKPLDDPETRDRQAIAEVEPLLKRLRQRVKGD